MKRLEQIQPLSREHHLSLLLAQKAIKMSADGQEDAIARLCQEIVSEYPDVWQVHFHIEEDSIFSHVKNRQHNAQPKEREVAQLCEQLQQEHLTMTAYYQQMKSGDYTILGDFGELLKQHTRTEERQLFPLLDELLSPEELDDIYQISLNYRLL
ncbi:MAG: hemerythrin domain-containing protein [gamma proteobacterium symbiont of Bathyaustriella thionipta]|nr:hemerythrin domain-containing protein [gamma proteobacterium symbiont of Bathyaustriella thionipta]MCU7950447.1 hemerythrin domain-containing protein [gamma proteobacterium symbiont of Bathyaustriella thionipta]MCU7954725.1 hemerythrin domain-containing protein [gamma proteobacterium symbiont of Bathyaustriella thionipta]MCU7956959.1 hemerythrin domain-containing protein [gamma proteobacterium symbiont of Bathyaustriella thionipta]MCU7966771.1 hemerythrin domain-containing protein [gamma pro